MQCPRCNKEWDVRLSPCPQCGLQVHLPGRLGSNPAHARVPRQPEPVADVLHLPGPPAVIKSSSAVKTGVAKALSSPTLVRHKPGNSTELPSSSRSTPEPPAERTRRPLRTSPLHGLDTVSSTAKEYLLSPDTLLHGGRYRLRNLQEIQEWSPDTFETTWSAQDMSRAGLLLVIRELVVVDKSAKILQSIAYNVTMAFTSSGGRLHIPMLRDTFIEHERCFFVFDMLDGHSLLALMRRAGGALPEAEVTGFCLQLCALLQEFSAQSPPLLHGLIRPEHILHERFGSQYIFTNFSLLLAGAAQQSVLGGEKSLALPYAAPEVSPGSIDVRSDLYALLAVAYHAITGRTPASRGYIQRAKQLNPRISEQFDTILSRGLSANVQQRYQQPAELLKELLQLSPAQKSDLAVTGLSAPSKQQSEEQLQLARHIAQAMTGIESPANFAASGSVSAAVLYPQSSLPLPEDLLPLTQSHDLRNALILFAILLLCMIPLLLNLG